MFHESGQKAEMMKILREVGKDSAVDFLIQRNYVEEAVAYLREKGKNMIYLPSLILVWVHCKYICTSRTTCVFI